MLGKQQIQQSMAEITPSIAPADQEIVLTFRSRLETMIPILDLRVFGSRARGDASEDSDLDLFIQVEMLDRPLRDSIHDLAWEVGFEYDRVISTFVVTATQVQEGAVGASPLLAKVLAEGIKI
ncbi:nucleotidyltransferase domain-containing protein [Spirulina sp. CCNP1310]|uniref:nucleotidyltransferase family protein n=1 Tax=Spirulina sp. CCNP1310 TaxID=3110249 RepID=UPI002B206535|nr:nucleotidyltransferase domain-containing protein [Spirulina sp. CCNP1310]MEA5420716.1 nucleotidyltransferase domain-containing protein [Spirulina sp. CCNP1310]